MLAEIRRIALIGCVLLFVLGGSAAQAQRSQLIDFEGVACAVSYRGPDSLHHGFFPITVELVNTSDRTAVVDFLAEQQWQIEDRVQKRVSLEPKERVTFEPLLRARNKTMNVYSARFTVNGKSQAVVVGPSEWSDGGEITVLYCSRDALEAGAIERWEAAWSNRSLTHVFANTTFGDLSEQWGAYSAYEWVVLSLEGGLPSSAVLDALFAYARSGGRLLIIGSMPRVALAGRKDDLKWLTPDYSAGVGRSASHAAFHFGQGVVTLMSDEPIGTKAMESSGGAAPDGRTAMQICRSRTWYPGAGGSNTGVAQITPLLEGFGELPLRGLMLLLVVFAVVMGPLNFWWVKRTKRPMLLLVTVPGISIVTSLGLVLFGIFSQGLDVKVATQSYTFLDQVGRHATTAEVRRVFAGSSPGAGLRPESGTFVFPGNLNWTTDFGNSYLFTQDLTNGRVYGGDFLPVREPIVQLIMSDRPSRLRLDVTSVGDAVEVSNALGGTVTKLYLRAMDGSTYASMSSLAAGETLRVVPNDKAGERASWSEVLSRFWGPEQSAKHRLPRGAYLAEVDSSELRDDCDVRVNEIAGKHYVFGVFAVDGGVAR